MRDYDLHRAGVHIKGAMRPFVSWGKGSLRKLKMALSEVDGHPQRAGNRATRESGPCPKARADNPSEVSSEFQKASDLD